MATEETLLDAVYRSPDDDAPRLIYADYLSDQGNPLGEFIRLQVQSAATGKRTRVRERKLWADHGAEWWPGHPARLRSAGKIPYERVHRGFPVSLALSTAAETRDAWRAALSELHGVPGWATVESLLFGPGTPPESVAPLLASSPFRALKLLRGVEHAAVEEVGALGLPIELLEIWNSSNLPLPRIGGLLRLKVLRVELENLVPEEALAVALPTTAVDRLARLELYGVSGPMEAIAETFRALPGTSCALRVGAPNNPTLELSGDRAAADLKLTLTPDDIDRVAEELEGVETSLFHSVSFELLKASPRTQTDSRAPTSRLERVVRRWG